MDKAPLLRTIDILMLAACFIVLCAPNAHSATATGTVSAQVLPAPLTISSSAPLDFGTILPGSGAGEVVVSPNASRSVTGGVNMQEGGATAASFTLEGTPGRAYTVSLPQSVTFTVSNALGTGSNGDLVVERFTASSASGNVLNSAGRDTLKVGGTLVVPPNVVPGNYSGLVPITVAYQ